MVIMGIARRGDTIRPTSLIPDLSADPPVKSELSPQITGYHAEHGTNVARGDQLFSLLVYTNLQHVES